MFFPQLLQKAGYRTAYIGKWHMGEAENDGPQPGFDHWVSFRGQGTYARSDAEHQRQARRVPGYTTDILTDTALEWLEAQTRHRQKQPFFMVLGHKAVHAEFVAAPRHKGRYATAAIPYPETMADTEANYKGKPRWVREQRNSWHGVDFMYHGAMEFDGFYRAYTETLLALDESVGRVLDYVDASGLSASTMVVYMSDNGFLLGEHGLIDKRHAYEESMRVPMLVYAPGLVTPGSKVTQVVRNIDIAPTMLELAGAPPVENMDGRSVLAALRGEPVKWEGEMVYEYYWEYAFPHTPTTLALRGDRYKFIYYPGVWDTQRALRPADRSEGTHQPDRRARAPGTDPHDAEPAVGSCSEASGAMSTPLRRGNGAAEPAQGRRLVHAYSAQHSLPSLRSFYSSRAAHKRRSRAVVQPRVTTAADPFLEDLERKTFEWFWDTTNARNGLVPDRWPDINFSSIAAIGFGLTAYGVGAERGYVTRAQARDRTLTTLRFLWNAPHRGEPREATGISRLLLPLPRHGEGAPLPDRRTFGDRHGADDGGRVVHAVVLRSERGGRARDPRSRRQAVSPRRMELDAAAPAADRHGLASRRTACTRTTTRAMRRR